jgi:hypothetical protein
LSIRELQGDIASSRRRPDAKVVRNENNIPPPIRSKRSKIEKPIFSGVYNKSIPEVNDELNNPTPEVQNPASLKIPGFVYAIGMCLAFSYFFK